MEVTNRGFLVVKLLEIRATNKNIGCEGEVFGRFSLHVET